MLCELQLSKLKKPGEFAWFTSADGSPFLSVSTLQLVLIIILVGADY